MPDRKTIGKSSTSGTLSQAGAFVRDEIQQIREAMPSALSVKRALGISKPRKRRARLGVVGATARKPRKTKGRAKTSEATRAKRARKSAMGEMRAKVVGKRKRGRPAGKRGQRPAYASGVRSMRVASRRGRPARAA